MFLVTPVDTALKSGQQTRSSRRTVKKPTIKHLEDRTYEGIPETIEERRDRGDMFGKIQNRRNRIRRAR